MPLLWVFLLVISVFPNAFSLDLPSSQIADDSLLRQRLKDTWLTESPARVLSRNAYIQNLESGERVEVRTVEGRDEFMVLLSRELMNGRIAGDNSPALPRSGTGQFPGWAQGSWMLIRKKDTGAGTLIRVFLRSDQSTYIQFRPFNPTEKTASEKCQLDAVLYGGYVTRSLPLPVPFERLYTMPLNEILNLAGDKFPRKYFDPDPVNYQYSRKFITLVRARLGELQFADDGAIDENGNYVFIETLQGQNPASEGLNCSGFAKWLVDGILRPVTGKRLSIPPLKAPFGDRGSNFTELWEDRDPFFGLDWIRNLASEANGVLRSTGYRNIDEFEVRSDTFSSIMVNENKAFVLHNYTGFLEEAGYSIEGIHPLLYTLAINEPGRFYLAAVNNERGPPATASNPRGRPRLRQYFHVAALVPYFDESGVFRVVVFESAEETSFSSFKTRYPGHCVNLVRIPVATAFNP
jgi:hypothetical protein